jgi:hypothetical protein
MTEDDDLELEDEVGEGRVPVVPEELDIDPFLLALLHCTAFLDFADEDTVDPAAASDVLEHVGLYIQRLPPDQLGEIQEQLDALEDHGRSAGWPVDIVEFVRDFLYNCGIGDDEEDEDEDEVEEADD